MKVTYLITWLGLEPFDLEIIKEEKVENTWYYLNCELINNYSRFPTQIAIDLFGIKPI